MSGTTIWCQELSALDFLHKLSWVKLVRLMFEAMVGNFAYSADIHLFINVINGALVLNCEDVVMLRFCMATYINAGHQFRNVFAVNGSVPPWVSSMKWTEEHF